MKSSKNSINNANSENDDADDFSEKSEDSNCFIVGITGGFGTGKSTLANFIKSCGFPVIFTDELARIVMEQENEVKNKIKFHFGEESYLSDGTVNSDFLARTVFSQGNSEKLELLNSIVHPPVIQKMLELTDDLEEKGESLIFIESALIYEAGLDEGFDYVIVVDCNEETLFSRAKAKGRFSEDDIRRRIAEQMPVHQKRNQADFVIENNKGIEQLQESGLMILNILKSLNNSVK